MIAIIAAVYGSLWAIHRTLWAIIPISIPVACLIIWLVGMAALDINAARDRDEVLYPPQKSARDHAAGQNPFG